MMKYLEAFNYVQTIVILVGKQMGPDSLKNKINNKLQITCITI